MAESDHGPEAPEPTGPLAGEDSRFRFRDRFRDSQLRLWDQLHKRMQGSLSIVVRVEHSMSLLVCYAAIGGLVAYLSGGSHA